MSTFIVGALVFGALAAVVRKLIRDRRKGAVCAYCQCGCAEESSLCGQNAAAERRGG
jgi:hypothetical protein